MLKKLNDTYQAYVVPLMSMIIFSFGVLSAVATYSVVPASAASHSDSVKQDYQNMLSRGEKKDCPVYMSKQVTCFKYTFCEAKSMGDSLIVYDGTSNQRMMYFTKTDVVSDAGDEYIGKISEFCIGK